MSRLSRSGWKQFLATRPVVLGALLLLASLLAFAPFAPLLPGTELDDAWRLAMNQAVAQGLVFGRDIVFTFGPYAALYTQHYHPATYPAALLLGVLFGLAQGTLLLSCLRRRHHGWLWVLAGFLLLVDSRDALFFAYPLLLTLVTCMESASHGSDDRLRFVGQETGHLLAIALLGALPIIKGSFWPLAVMASLVGALLHGLKGERLRAALFVLLPLLTLLLLWGLAGQPLAALPDYFRTLSPIISGFAEAMSNRGLLWQVVVYLGLAAGIILATLRSAGPALPQRLAITLAVGLFLFIAFKAGFVRHDRVHVGAISTGTVLAILAIQATHSAKLPRSIVVTALLMCLFMHLRYIGLSIEQTPLAALRGVTDNNPLDIRQAFTERMRQLATQSPLPRLPGSSDIYPFDLTDLIASGNHWAPRPVLQSYSAYTPLLARMNEAHLRGAAAPDNIFFRIESIDGRFPSLDDGLSWPTLLSHYQITGSDRQYLHLQRRTTPATTQKTVLTQQSHRLGEWVSLPSAAQMLFAEIELAPTLLGRLSMLLFKPGQLYLSVDLGHGEKRVYRFIPGMALAGFVLSPLVESTAEFARLANGQPPSLHDTRVVQRIRILSSRAVTRCGESLTFCEKDPEKQEKGSNSFSWRSDYRLTLTALAIPAHSVSRQAQ